MKQVAAVMVNFEHKKIRWWL